MKEGKEEKRFDLFNIESVSSFLFFLLLSHFIAYLHATIEWDHYSHFESRIEANWSNLGYPYLDGDNAIFVRRFSAHNGHSIPSCPLHPSKVSCTIMLRRNL